MLTTTIIYYITYLHLRVNEKNKFLNSAAKKVQFNDVV